jgi:hypothetical protein
MFDPTVPSRRVGQRHHDAHNPLRGLRIGLGDAGELGCEVSQYWLRMQLAYFG